MRYSCFGRLPLLLWLLLAAYNTHLSACVVLAVCKVHIGCTAKVICMYKFMRDCQLHLTLCVQLVMTQHNLCHSPDGQGRGIETL